MTIPMNKNALVVSLFVHDMKAPLAIIDLGASRLIDQMKQGDAHDTINNTKLDLLDTIIQLKKRAVTVLNQILRMEPQGVSSRDAGTKKKEKTELLSGFFTLIKRVIPTKERAGNGVDLTETVETLQLLLLDILLNINLLEDKMGCQKERIKNGHATLARMLRNAKTAVHFSDNAMAVLLGRQPSGHITSCKIASIIQQAMVELFDLVDPDTSKAVLEAKTLAQLRKELAVQEVYLDVDEIRWGATFNGDNKKINQVLVNLLMNAVKFRKSSVVLDVAHENGQMIFSVYDDGRGISQKDQQQIFKQQFQVKSEGDFPIRGHGIGLAGAQALLEGINGYLHLESVPGEGACFSAVLDGIEENRVN